MKQLFNYADKYIRQSTWKELALLKFCLFAMGVLVGIHIPEKNRKPVGIAAVAVFAATYIPLMAKFASVVLEEDTEEDAPEEAEGK